jgi:hypothetical protein
MKWLSRFEDALWSVNVEFTVAKLVESFGRRGDSPKVLTTFATNDLVTSTLTDH